MRVDRQLIDGVTVVTVAEPLEVAFGNADDFREAALQAIGDATDVVLDASLVGFFDSDGMSALLTLQKRVGERRGRMVLAGLNRSIQEIFTMVGFDVVFLTYPDVPQAVAALRT